MSDSGEALLKITDVVKELEADGYRLRIHTENLLEIGGDENPILQIIKLDDNQWRASKIPNASANGHAEVVPPPLEEVNVLPTLEEVSEWLLAHK